MSYPSFNNGDKLYASDMNAVGLWKVTPTSVAGTGVAISGSNVTMAGTSGYAAVNGVFTSNYRFYRIEMNYTISNQPLFFRLRTGGSDNVANNYGYITTYRAYSNAVVGYFNGLNLSAGVGGYCDVNTTAHTSLDIANPALTLPTNITGTCSWATYGAYLGINHTAFTAFDGFSIYAGTGNLSGQIQIYGYN